jgi:chloramphenicol-sensitive protein RarD
LLLKTMKHSKDYKNGIITLLGCNTLWGVLPVYWQALRPIDSWVIIFYRIFLVGLVAGAASLKVYGWSEIKKHLMIKKNLLLFPVTGLLITCNWSIYIWAVNADYVIQTCVGYYIEPLVVCLFGLVLFRERLTRYKMGAMLMALVGIVIILFHFGELPNIALGLAFSFAIYAALKKNFNLPAIMSVFLETFFLMWPALGVVIYLESTGQGALAVGEPNKYALMLLSGVLTATPLSLFANGAKKVPLVVTGLMEYIGPSITLIIGIFFMKEPFDVVQLIAFIFIWIGLIYFTIGEFKMPDPGSITEEQREITNEI